MPYKPSKYQEAIYSFIKEEKGNLIVEADAGTGKTLTIKISLNFIPPSKSVVFCAFSSSIATELRKDIPSYVQALTLHSLGLKSITGAFGKVKVDGKKLFRIVINLINEDERKYISPMMKVVSLLKNNLLPPTNKSIEGLLFHHNIELPENFDRFVTLTTKAFEKSNENTKVIDFDDMIFFSHLYNLPCKKYDFVFVDEAQDLNNAQISLVMKSVKPNGRVIAVGDKNQAIYGFRGAGIDSIPKLKQLLQAESLPLSICYRCPRTHVEQAQKYVSSIEVAPNAKDGKIIVIPESELSNKISSGDLILCRNNAPLIAPCLDLISKGIKATIKGRDIGLNLATLIEKLRSRTIPELKIKLEEWENNEIQNAIKKNKNPQLIVDKAECLFSLIENSGAKTPRQLAEHIRDLFSDEKAEITFSSIHRAKGLESENVFFLQPYLIPSKYAEQDWELAQEKNLYYVALTRAKENLYMVN